jgi:serine protease Do
MARSLGLPAARGAIISGVTEGSPAERAGLKEGDVVLSIDGQQIEDSRDLTQKVGASLANTDTRLDIQREGGRRTVTVRLGERPSERQLAAADGGDVPGDEAPNSGANGEAARSLGVTVRPATAQDRRNANRTGGVVVEGIEDESPLADRLAPGIIIVEAGGRPVTGAADLEAAADAAKRGAGVLLLQVEDRTGRRAFIPLNLQEQR